MNIGDPNVRIPSVQRLILLAVFVLVLFLCLQGITAATLHPDQMALRPLFNAGLLPFNPGWFEKPPFHTYTNFFLSVVPTKILGVGLGLDAESLFTLRVAWSRLLTVLMYFVAVGFFFTVIRKCFSSTTATLLSVLLVTSSGLITHSHFLTADIPVLAWMLVAFYFSQRVLLEGRMSDYVLAGVLTGIATATKYNGLAVGLAIPAAHYLRVYYLERQPFRWAEFIFPPRLALGVACVIPAFVLANPFAVLDYSAFVHDFVYNYKVTPVYDGSSGSSYGDFFHEMIEIHGLPGFVLLAAGGLGSIVLALTSGVSRVQKAFTAMAFAVFFVYYIEFAQFPRLEIRFVMPIVPIAALIAALAVERVRSRPALFAAGVSIVAAVVLYNAICAYQVGSRFKGDPLLEATRWLTENVPAHSEIEVDSFAPSWSKRAAPVTVVEMPYLTSRERLFQENFKDDRDVVGTADFYRRVDEMERWYSATALARRKPDFLIVNSLYYSRFTEVPSGQRLYPAVRDYFRDLLAERLGYRIVFDQSSIPMPVWAYPQHIDAQRNRVIVLRKGVEPG